MCCGPGGHGLRRPTGDGSSYSSGFCCHSCLVPCGHSRRHPRAAAGVISYYQSDDDPWLEVEGWPAASLERASWWHGSTCYHPSCCHLFFFWIGKLLVHFLFFDGFGIPCCIFSSWLVTYKNANYCAYSAWQAVSGWHSSGEAASSWCASWHYLHPNSGHLHKDYNPKATRFGQFLSVIYSFFLEKTGELRFIILRRKWDKNLVTTHHKHHITLWISLIWPNIGEFCMQGFTGKSYLQKNWAKSEF